MNTSRVDICVPDHVSPIIIPPLEQENYQIPLWQVIASLAVSIFIGSLLLSSIDIYRNRAVQLAREVEQHQGANAIQNLAEQMPSTWPTLVLGTLACSWLSANLVSHYCAGRNVVIFPYQTFS